MSKSDGQNVFMFYLRKTVSEILAGQKTSFLGENMFIKDANWHCSEAWFPCDRSQS